MRHAENKSQTCVPVESKTNLNIEVLIIDIFVNFCIAMMRPTLQCKVDEV